ncbi:MAG: GNAT family N-acetyltransferase [Alphaproteobacteria bacterium]|nr:GNAT family N-acetyltransferase [Alphaproteobacteria bacterium]
MGLFRDDGIENLHQVSFEVSDTISDQDLSALRRGISEHVLAQGVPPLTDTPLSIFKYDDHRNVVAGLVGYTFWNWLYVDYLWVAAAIRKTGLGRALMEAAEEEAEKRGCIGVYLWTHPFSASTFCSQLGYQKFVVIDDLPIGHKCIGFMKRLVS